MNLLSLSNWVVVGCLALPHLLYAYIWFFPHKWRALFKKQSVDVFEKLAWLLKGADSLLDAAISPFSSTY